MALPVSPAYAPVADTIPAWNVSRRWLECDPGCPPPWAVPAEVVEDAAVAQAPPASPSEIARPSAARLPARASI